MRMLDAFHGALAQGKPFNGAVTLAISFGVAIFPPAMWHNKTAWQTLVAEQATLAADFMLETAQFQLATFMMCSIVHIENVDRCLEHSEDSGTLVCNVPTSDFLKLKDAKNGCTSTLAKFICKRLPCFCLEKLYRRKPRTGVCENCGGRRRASQLMVCSGCNYVQYCSVQCQRVDWPSHKKCCGFDG